MRVSLPLATLTTAAVLMSGCVPAAPPAGPPNGYAHNGRFPATAYTVRVHHSAASMAADVAWAAAQVSARSGVRLELGAPASSTRPDPDAREIVVYIGHTCGGSSVGCAERWIDSSTLLVRRGAISVVEQYRRHELLRPLLLHEFGHILGLDHNPGTYNGRFQVMYPNLRWEVTTLQQGDINGLRYSGQEGARRVAARSPRGSLDEVRTEPGAVTVRGWAHDPDQQHFPTPVSVTVDGEVVVENHFAKDPVPRLATEWPGIGVNHAFSHRVVLPPGAHEVCAIATNIGWGYDTTLGCRTVHVAASSATMQQRLGSHAAVAAAPPQELPDPLVSPPEPRELAERHGLYGPPGRAG